MKKIFNFIIINKDKNIFFRILHGISSFLWNFFLKIIPSKIYLKQVYSKNFNKKLNLNDPQRFTEKIQWKKLYDHNPLYTKCADKYLVREYVKEKIGEKYLIPLLYQTDKPEEIPFDKLPLPYIIKANHGCGWNIIIRDRKDIHKKEIISKCRNWLKSNIYFIGREWQYKDIKPRVLIEKLILDERGLIPEDYKFQCFGGKVEFIQVDTDRFDNHKKSFYDSNWKFLPFVWCTQKNNKPTFEADNKINKPKNLKKMVKIAEKLSKDFDFVRVDLYFIDNKIYFGELTFTPSSGLDIFFPEKYNLIYGKKLNHKGYKKNSS